MPNVISWKKSEIASLRGQMEDFFDHFFLRLSRSCQESGLMEVADWLVEENDQRLLLKLLAPDVSPEEIEVTITEDTLTIKLRKEQTGSCGEADEKVQEKTYQSCFRSLRIPSNVKRDEISARYVEGTLTIELPKAEKRVYRIPIKD
jgi:HSP20 family protein